MRIISISTDRSLCDPESAVANRHRAYGACAEFHIIVCTLRGFTTLHLSDRVHIYPTNSSTPWMYGVDVLRIVWAMRGDIVTVQNPFEIGIIGLIVSRIKRVPLHVQIHTDLYSPYFIGASWAQCVRTLLARIVLRCASRIRVVLERTRDELRMRAIRVPITVLPIFVDRAHFESLPRRKHSRFKVAFLFVGRLEAEKRPEVALKALAHVRDAGHDAGLTFVGDGTLLSQLREAVRKYGLERHVVFMGHQKTLDHFYEEADALLVPSLFEGYGMAMVEALSAGVPVIATNVGVAQDAGAIIAPHDPAEFARRTLEWVQHGNQKGELTLTLRDSLTEYARAYCDDIGATSAEA